jgi:hypothetical protein
VKTMAEVLHEASGKLVDGGRMVYLAPTDVARIADALTAAGFGPVKAAQAGALRDAADDLEAAPYETLTCYATIRDYSDALNVSAGIQAGTRWLRARAAAVEGRA